MWLTKYNKSKRQVKGIPIYVFFSIFNKGIRSVATGVTLIKKRVNILFSHMLAIFITRGGGWSEEKRESVQNNLKTLYTPCFLDGFQGEAFVRITLSVEKI